MKKLIKACLFVGIGAFFTLITLLNANPSVVAWTGETINILSSRPATEPFTTQLSCPSTTSPFLLGSDPQSKQGCMYGDIGGSRFVRYLDAAGAYRYGFSRANEIVFYPLKDVCQHAAFCVYSQKNDTLLMQTTISQYGMGHVAIQDFSKHLNFFIEDGGHFRYDFQAASTVIGVGSKAHFTGAVGISANGGWAVVELRDYGLIRINLADLTMRRIAAPGSTYGLGTDPGFELAVSNSGQQVAKVGYRAGLDVYTITDNCGDILSDTSQTHFNHTITTPCPSAPIERFSLFPGFMSAHIPKFSIDGGKLSVYIVTASSRSHVIMSSVGRPMSNDPMYYRAFGDSFTSGEGELDDAFYKEGTNSATNRCHVSTRSYPYLLGNFWSYTADNMSCSGSTTKNVLETYLKFFNDTRNTYGPPFASLGVGGNDVNLMNKLKTCLGLDTCEWATVEKRLSSSQEIQDLLPKMVDLIVSVRQYHPETRWFVVGYPLVINASDSAQCSPLVAAMLDKSEREYMNETVKLLNSVLKSAAHTTHTRYVDIENALAGERLCDSSPRSMNALRLGDDMAPIPPLPTLKLIGAESFHPTPTGHEKVYASIKQQLSSDWQEIGCGPCNSQYVVSDYWTQPPQNTTIFRQIAQKFLQAKEIVSGMKIPFYFPAGTFMPKTTVTFELHSTPSQIGTGQVNDDGSLQGEVRLTEGIDGYHTVHAFGMNAYGKPIDIYEIVAIEEAKRQRLEYKDISQVERTDLIAKSTLSLSEPTINPVASFAVGEDRFEDREVNYKPKIENSNKNPQASPPASPNYTPIIIGGIGSAFAIGIAGYIWRKAQKPH